jgi:hypothetical protein
LVPLYNFVSCLRTFQKRRNIGALQNASDDHRLEVTATFWRAALLRRFFMLC